MKGTINDMTKTKGQAFLLLGVAALLLLAVVPGLLLAGSNAADHAARTILFVVALTSTLAGLILSAIGLLLLSRKPKTVKATI